MLNPVMPVRLPVVAAAAVGLLLASCDRDAEPAAPPPKAAAPAAEAPASTPHKPSLDRIALSSAVAQDAATIRPTAPAMVWRAGLGDRSAKPSASA